MWRKENCHFPFRKVEHMKLYIAAIATVLSLPAMADEYQAFTCNALDQLRSEAKAGNQESATFVQGWAVGVMNMVMVQHAYEMREGKSFTVCIPAEQFNSGSFTDLDRLLKMYDMTMAGAEAKKFRADNPDEQCPPEHFALLGFQREFPCN